jgi:23S rRNA (cytidine1920-2'-O)/16S rRNA (cytidine1409-2'-O)-methyltransferase
MSSKRLDVLMVERGLTESREQAQRLILAGEVRVNDQVADKAGHKYDEDVSIGVESGARFVGRGGEKLDAAFVAFNLEVAGKVCLDVGASTGGFTDCMLQRGAALVYAVDVGKGQVAWTLRKHPRVVVMEGVNARYLRKEQFPERPSFAAVDVSFISLTKVLPAVIEVLLDTARIVTLIKPQFEAGRKEVGRGGVVRDPKVHADVMDRIRSFGVNELHLRWMGCVPSPLIGPAGNREFLACWECPIRRRSVVRSAVKSGEQESG